MKRMDGITASYRISHDGLIGAEISTLGHMVTVRPDGRLWFDQEGVTREEIDLSIRELAWIKERARMSEGKGRHDERAFGARRKRRRHKYTTIPEQSRPALAALFMAIKQRFDIKAEAGEPRRAYLRQPATEAGVGK